MGTLRVLLLYLGFGGGLTVKMWLHLTEDECLRATKSPKREG